MSPLLLLLILLFLLVFLVLIIKFIHIIFFQILSILLLGGGGVYVKSDKEIVKKMVALLGIKQGDKAVDLGSGDGRLVIALAEAGAQAHGYEINPFLVWLSRINIKKAGLQGNAFIHRKNFWHEDFSEFNAITLYCISYAMKDLEIKLKKELKPGAKIVSNYFTFPDWQPQKNEGNVRLYIR